MVGSGLPIFGGVLFLGGLLILIYLLLKVIKSLKEETKEKAKPKRGVQNVLLLFLALLLLISSRLCFWTGESLRSYQIYFPDKCTGEIFIESAEKGEKYLVYSFLDRKGERYTYRSIILGEKCQMEAEFLRWDPWLKDLGLVSAYKMVRLKFTSLEEPSIKTKDLPGSDNPFWEWIKRFDKPLFFVKTKLLKSDFIDLDFSQPRELMISGDSIVLKPEPPPLSPDTTPD
jgi:hypothetical protein